MWYLKNSPGNINSCFQVHQYCNSSAYSPQASRDKTVNRKIFSLFNLNRKVLKSVNELCLCYQGKQLSKNTRFKAATSSYMWDSWNPTGVLHFLGNNYICFCYFTYSVLIPEVLFSLALNDPLPLAQAKITHSWHIHWEIWRRIFKVICF